MTHALLIVEESLRDLKAHWFEYIKTITHAAQTQGYRVDVACHRDAAPEIKSHFNSFPIFRHARYLDNQTQKLPGERYYGFMLHSLRSLAVLWPLLKQRDRYAHIFVPTVLIHHLLAWWIIMKAHPHRPEHLTLFFVANPGIWDAEQQQSVLPTSPLTRIQRFLLRLFQPMVQRGVVTLGVETKGAKHEFETLTHVPFCLLPHPVSTVALSNALSKPHVDQPRGESLLFACYGFARYEKGSDVLKAAIQILLSTHNSFPGQFCIQWVDPFTLPDGTLCDSKDLRQHSSVRLIERPLLSDDYQALLQQTDVMILPYRNSSYHARVSRIAIEAVCLAIPIIYTQGGWLEDVVTEFGAGVGVEDESVESLNAAIATVTSTYAALRQQAIAKQAKAQHYFSGETFCQILFSESAAVPVSSQS